MISEETKIIYKFYNDNLTVVEFSSRYTAYALYVSHRIQSRKEISNNRHTSSTPIDLYEIPHIFYTRIIPTICLQTPTGYILALLFPFPMFCFEERG